MGSFKVTIDRIENSVAVLLVRDDESVLLTSLLFYYLGGAGKVIFWIFVSPEMYGGQKPQKEKSQHCLNSFKIKMKIRIRTQEVGVEMKQVRKTPKDPFCTQ